MMDLKELTRPNIWNLSPYSSARNEYSGHTANVFLDANENPYNSPLNRYPDPLQSELKTLVARVKGVPAECIFLGNGSDEAIDLAYRCFTQPGVNNVVAIEPTYGMYKVCADINDIEYRPVLLDNGFQMNADSLLSACDADTRLIWLCSPNNPTGNNLKRNEIEEVLRRFHGLVIVDEAYSDFSTERPFRLDLDKFPNLIVLNTMSKAWGCAAIRLGMAFASKEIISLFNKVKYPYNISSLTQEQAIEAFKDPYKVDKWIKIILLERTRMIDAFGMLPSCKKVYPTNANFFLAEMDDAQATYDYLVRKGIIVRNRNKVALCANCLRITIGTKTENNELLAALRQRIG
ncbi:histidinol-phosphate transaminase [Marseilla massiliensis]|uniref:Histidinol-phosphate aminotransferase n=1 Tax=Marseilla massiliensis TaxID=1841864 RepID=A0A938WNI1_9BACT|nr:histidinol-phosphate transaminase [Marseilla massiliensis]MBM6662272.1 histidinol-phosphate transaminase [Marseilla massiliensis]